MFPYPLAFGWKELFRMSTLSASEPVSFCSCLSSCSSMRSFSYTPLFTHSFILIVYLALFSMLLGCVYAADHGVHHRLVPHPVSFDLVARDRDIGKPIKVTNRCLDVIHPGVSTQTGAGPSTHGFELKSGTSRTLTVGSNWQGRVWGRTNCSFNAAGTGASNRGGLNGAGKACMTGDCSGLLDCKVSVSESSDSRIFGIQYQVILRRGVHFEGRYARHPG